MKESGVIRIKEHPKLMREAALWFHEKWGEVPVSAYLESMKESLRGEASVPGWYLYITGGSIAAGSQDTGGSNHTGSGQELTTRNELFHNDLLLRSI